MIGAVSRSCGRRGHRETTIPDRHTRPRRRESRGVSVDEARGRAQVCRAGAGCCRRGAVIPGHWTAAASRRVGCLWRRWSGDVMVGLRVSGSGRSRWRTRGVILMLIRSRWAAIGAAVAVSLGAGGIGMVAASVNSGDRPVTVTISPERVLDTRSNLGLVGPFVKPFTNSATIVGSSNPWSDGSFGLISRSACVTSGTARGSRGTLRGRNPRRTLAGRRPTWALRKWCRTVGFLGSGNPSRRPAPPGEPSYRRGGAPREAGMFDGSLADRPSRCVSERDVRPWTAPPAVDAR